MSLLHQKTMAEKVNDHIAAQEELKTADSEYTAALLAYEKAKAELLTLSPDVMNSEATKQRMKDLKATSDRAFNRWYKARHAEYVASNALGK